jgi:hypothetical protein
MPSKQTPVASTKREKFEEAGRFPVKKVSIIGAVVVVVALGAFLGIWFGTRAPEAGGQVVQQNGADYSGGKVAMTVLDDATVAGGNLQIPIADVTAKKIVGVLYNRTTPMPDGYNDIKGNALPLLAYVAPSGRLVVASSLCEPCHSYEFHIEGTDLVCNSCGTRWDLNTLEGKSGGCLSYPPNELKATVAGGTLSVPTGQLESWLPRT